jgi:argininosuccinate lyase
LFTRIRPTEYQTEFLKVTNITATDAADTLAKKENIGFREAHSRIGKQIQEGKFFFSDPLNLIKAKNHTGSPNPSQVKKQIEQLQKLQSSNQNWLDKHTQIEEKYTKELRMKINQVISTP